MNNRRNFGPPSNAHARSLVPPSNVKYLSNMNKGGLLNYFSFKETEFRIIN
jgi:hypothetical protein